MQDLNMTMFFKAKFTITSTSDKPDDLLWKLVMRIRAWITRKWNRDEWVVETKHQAWTAFKMGGKLYDLEHRNRIYAESLRHENADGLVSWACKIVEKPEAERGFAPRSWVTEIGFQERSATEAELSYVVTFSDQPGFVGPCQDVPFASVPKVVRSLLNDYILRCHIGADDLTLEPHRLEAGDFPAFRELLLREDREVPIIYISPCCDEEGNARLLADPRQLADCVAANALVYYSESPDFTREMSYLGDSRYTCSGGAVRVYRPHIAPSDANDHRRHRYLSAGFLTERTAAEIADIFRRAFAQDVYFYEQLFRLNTCRTLIEEDERRDRLALIRAKSRNEIAAAENDAAAAAELLEEVTADLDQAERTISELTDQNDQLRTENHNTQFRIEQLQERAVRYDEMAAAAQDARGISEYPNSPESIVAYFETVYPDRIVFTERGHRSLSDCSMKNELLWEVLYHMVTELYDLLHADPANAYKLFKEHTGWDCSRGEGAQTRGNPRLMREYADWYDGQQIDIEPHIKNGGREGDPRFIRIHFAYEPMLTDKIIVGHCGKHLENASTQKAKK